MLLNLSLLFSFVGLSNVLKEMLLFKLETHYQLRVRQEA